MKIEFKSKPKFYKKELLGLKNNTIREIDEVDERFKELKEMEDTGCLETDMIRITNSRTGNYFERQIKDVTFFKEWCIITWRT